MKKFYDGNIVEYYGNKYKIIEYTEVEPPFEGFVVKAIYLGDNKIHRFSLSDEFINYVDAKFYWSSLFCKCGNLKNEYEINCEDCT